MKRENRLERLRNLVRKGGFTSQRDLLKALSKKRISIDQSTLSRDLIEIGADKIDGRYQLVTRARPGGAEFDLSSVIRSWKPCGANLIVIHTAIGQAQAVGVALDRSAEPAIGGTLAGDDTIFVATSSRARQTAVLRRLKQWFGEKRDGG
jgi:transcriptional regulator of arginine metabolism